MGNINIEQRVISVFWNKFQFHAERLSETQKADSLLNPEIALFHRMLEKWVSFSLHLRIKSV